MAEEGIELLHPAQCEAVAKAIVNAGVVENDEPRYWFGNLQSQVFHEIDEGFEVVRRNGLRVI